MAKDGPTPAQLKALVAEVKKNPGNSERYYSEKSGIEMGQIGKALYWAEVEADPSLKIPATEKSIVAAVNKGTLRWPRIAAYAGITVGQAKALYKKGTGKDAPSNITGRGRPFSGTSASTKAAGRGAGKKQASGTSGRRGKVAGGKPAASKPAAAGGRGRRGTRAGASPR